MKNESPKKTEVFLFLALRHAARLHSAEKNDAEEIFFAKMSEQLSAADAKKLEKLRVDYQNKSEAEKQKWRGQIEKKIVSGELFIDETIHWSHVETALQKENPAIRRIIIEALSAEQKKHFSEEIEANNQSVRFDSFKKNIRKTFARQFIALRDLSSVSAFDRLNGAQFARLIRLAGIYEVALACVRIPAVESVAAFLRRFSAEDARTIAAQLSGLSNIENGRLLFAENLVQNAMEIEEKPSAMLDLLGIWLVGLLLCGSEPARINYISQKLPLEVAPKLSEIIETQCFQTPIELQREISAELERIAEMLAKSARKIYEN